MLRSDSSVPSERSGRGNRLVLWLTWTSPLQGTESKRWYYWPNPRLWFEKCWTISSKRRENKMKENTDMLLFFTYNTVNREGLFRAPPQRGPRHYQSSQDEAITTCQAQRFNVQRSFASMSLYSNETVDEVYTWIGLLPHQWVFKESANYCTEMGRNNVKTGPHMRCEPEQRLLSHLPKSNWPWSQHWLTQNRDYHVT